MARIEPPWPDGPVRAQDWADVTADRIAVPGVTSLYAALSRPVEVRHRNQLQPRPRPAGLASGFRLAADQLDRLDTKSAFDLEE